MRVRPYKGNDNFIFLSYSHKDMKEVFELVDQLQKHGYNVWFDEGIDPGTEWDEMIARHIQECSYFIGYITKNYIDSQNCRDELNFARDLDKDRLMVYGEEVELPIGMQMRMNRLQAIFKYRYAYPEDFYEKLFNAYGIQTCKSKEPESDTEERTEPVADEDIDWSTEPTIINKPKQTIAEVPGETRLTNVLNEVIAAHAQDATETGDDKFVVTAGGIKTDDLTSLKDESQDPGEITEEQKKIDRTAIIFLVAAILGGILCVLSDAFWWVF